MVNINSKFLFIFLILLQIVNSETPEEIAEQFKTDIETELDGLFEKYNINKEDVEKEFPKEDITEQLEIVIKSKSEKNAFNIEVKIILEIMNIDESLKEYLEKVVSRFSQKVGQVEFKLEELKDDIIKMMKLEFQFPEEERTEKVFKIEEIADKEIKNDLLLDIIFEKNQIKNTIEFFITSDESSPDSETELNFIINLSNPKYDSIKLQLKKTELNDKDAIEINVISGYFNFNYIINILSKRFLLKTVEDCFHKIKNEIYNSLEILNQSWDPETDNIIEDLTKYIGQHKLYFNSENLSQSNNAKNCLYNFKILQTSEFNLNIHFDYDPLGYYNEKNRKYTKIIIEKDFPLDSMYNPTVFPKLFIKDLVENLVSIVPLSGVDENFFFRVSSDEMTKPFIEYVQDKDNNLLKLVEYNGKEEFDIDLIGIEFENELQDKMEDDTNKIYRVDYVFKPKERRARIKIKRNLI